MKGSDTQEKILQTAIHLIRTKSYNSFSYKDIANEIGIKKASIHYHFEVKNTLGISAIQEYRSRAEYLMRKVNKLERTPKEALDDYFEFFRKDLMDKNEVCLGGVMVAEFNTLTEEIQNELNSFISVYFSWLEAILEKGKSNGTFTFSNSAYNKALYITSAVQGAVMMARAMNKEYFEIVVNQIKYDLNKDCQVKE
ncbi:MAG: TetR/AcrR family transcriptional regulator [Candidatus Heimdallarchaeota archaeon]|nr:TetR/AcrR family transcriptional regulator [Candidatus Heimdallarchaeota archaeon]